MDLMTSVVAGAIFGFLGFLAPGILFERALADDVRVSLGAAIAGILSSFLMQMAALLAVHLLAGERLLPFGCAMVASFLLMWGEEALRAWRVANGGTTKAGRE